MSKPLKLIIQSAGDLPVISSALQDSTVRIGDMAWLKSEALFAFVGNRYRWEKKGWFRRPKGERVRTAFHLNSVSNAQLHNIDPKDSDTILELLNIEANKQDSGYMVRLNFAGDSGITLHTDSIDGLLSDIGDSWDAIERPRHDLSDATFQ